MPVLEEAVHEVDGEDDVEEIGDDEGVVGVVGVVLDLVDPEEDAGDAGEGDGEEVEAEVARDELLDLHEPELRQHAQRLKDDREAYGELRELKDGVLLIIAEGAEDKRDDDDGAVVEEVALVVDGDALVGVEEVEEVGGEDEAEDELGPAEVVVDEDGVSEVEDLGVGGDAEEELRVVGDALDVSLGPDLVDEDGDRDDVEDVAELKKENNIVHL